MHFTDRIDFIEFTLKSGIDDVDSMGVRSPCETALLLARPLSSKGPKFMIKGWLTQHRRRLLITKRGGGVDLHGAAGRYVAGGQGDTREQNGYGRKVQRVGGADAIKLRGQKAGEAEGGGEARDNAYESETEAFAKHETQNVAALSAESQPNADLTRALADKESNNAVNSNNT